MEQILIQQRRENIGASTAKLIRFLTMIKVSSTVVSMHILREHIHHENTHHENKHHRLAHRMIFHSNSRQRYTN